VGGAFALERDDDLIAAVRERFGLHGTRVIFNVAGLDVRKNVATLLRAFARVHAACGEDVRLIMGGSAHGNAALYPDPVPLARELGISERVVFTGAITDAEKVAFYHLADCYAAPSVYEGFGLTPLEAMACGTPVVAAEASCTPEVVGDAALLVAPDDVGGFSAAMQRVLTDADLARDLRERGLRRAAQFTWERTATETYAVYQQALCARARAATAMTSEQPMETVR
jgi:glycosyltransferase involved in cell wall biosynthesis